MQSQKVADTFLTTEGITSFVRWFHQGFMVQESRPVTKILFIDADEISFQVSQCIAKVASKLPPVELFHAHDATEGLQMLENVKPDVVVIDDDLNEERDLFIESLTKNHPPVLIQTDGATDATRKETSPQIIRTPKGESLDGIRQILVLAAAVANRPIVGGKPEGLH